jgi:hypothetical protein
VRKNKAPPSLFFGRRGRARIPLRIPTLETQGRAERRAFSQAHGPMRKVRKRMSR